MDNLCKDVFLRKNMDSQGFVLLSLVAGFNRVQRLTTDLDLIKFICHQSPNIDWYVGDDGKDRLRPRHNWQQWVYPMEERDAAARNDGPTNVRAASVPMPQGFDQQTHQRLHSVPNMPASALATTAPWSQMNGAPASYGPLSPTESQNGQLQPQPVLVNGYGAYPGYAPETQASTGPQQTVDHEADSFSDAQAGNLMVIVKNGDPAADDGQTANAEIEVHDKPTNRQDSTAVANGTVSPRG